MNQNILQTQIKAAQARIKFWTALISTGAYQYRKVKPGQAKNQDGQFLFKPLTKNELLQDTLEILYAHVDALELLA